MVYRKIIISFCLLGLLLPLTKNLSALEVHTYVKDHIFYTEGTVDAIDWYDRGLAAMIDYANYNAWLIRGIDGKDPVSATFWENFVNFKYEGPDIMVVEYDLNLGWPLGSKGNKARFKIDDSQIANGILRMHILDKPTGLESAVLSLIGEDSPTNPGTKQVRFQIAIRFGWLLEALLDANKYGSHMNIILGIMVNNLKEYSQNPANIAAGKPTGAPSPTATISTNPPTP